METTFGVIRHAQTEWNRRKLIQGRQDSPLTPEGEARAIAWGLRLSAFGWDGILTSDAGRALATAERINRHLNLQVGLEPRLRELDWGRWTGMTVARLRVEEPELVAEQEAAGWDFRPPGGESRRRQLERSLAALTAAARSRPGARILVVTHEGVIKSLAMHLRGKRFLPADTLAIRADHLHWITERGQGLVLDGLNAVALSAAGTKGGRAWKT